MKVIQTLKPIDCFGRIQKTDGYFNATIFLDTFNNNIAKIDVSLMKQMKDYKVLKSTKEFVSYLVEYENIEKPIKASNKGTWMHYKVFIDFAMWISVEFKSMAIEWVFDGLLKSRNDAGDYYLELTSSIADRHIKVFGCKPSPMVYINEARYLKSLCDIDDRNTATEKQLNMLNTLQLLDIKLIKDGVGKNSRYKQLENLSIALNFNK